MEAEGRSKERDKLVCVHEAAHAVTAESLVPFCTAYVTADPHHHGELVVPSGAEAAFHYKTEMLDDFTLAVVTAASEPGEKLVGHLIDPTFPTRTGDEGILLQLAAEGLDTRRARRKAERLVAENRKIILVVAAVLRKERYMPGYRLREIIGNSLLSESLRTH